MEDISLCLKEKMVETGIETLKRMRRMITSDLQSDQKISDDCWTVGLDTLE